MGVTGMSKPKKWWFGFVCRVLEHYDMIADGSLQGAVWGNAIAVALRETEAMENGAERVKLINMLFFKKTHNIDGAAMRLYISSRTATRWKIDFVYLVAEKAGFMT